jgi:hypothetical protein
VVTLTQLAVVEVVEITLEEPKMVAQELVASSSFKNFINKEIYMDADDNRLERIEDKIDKLDEHLARIDITLTKQSVILDEHQKRSTNLEERMEPIEEHIQGLKGVVKFLKMLGIVAAILEAARALRIF